MSSLVLPVLPFGPTPEHRGFGSGYVDVPVAVHERLVRAGLRSLADQGFGQIVVWREGTEAMTSGAWSTHSTASARVGSGPVFPGTPSTARGAVLATRPSPAATADSFATLIALYLRPESVRVEKIVDPAHDAVDWADPNLDFSAYSSTGVIGDPTHASVELGKRLWSGVVEEVSGILRDIARDGEAERLDTRDRLHFLCEGGDAVDPQGIGSDGTPRGGRRFDMVACLP